MVNISTDHVVEIGSRTEKAKLESAMEGEEELLNGKTNHRKAEFDIVCSNLDLKIGDTKILSGVSAVFRAGEISALMGPTGAGKTSLLKCIGHRVAHGGSTSYGGKKWTKAMRRRTAFVEQNDIIWVKLTVYQTLMFTARLRLSLTPKDLVHRVEDVIQILRLAKCRDTKLDVCSGGQKRRVCIAKELLTDPRIMLMDEITSGLDSTMAQVVVETVREVARRNKLVVIMSIHQPNSAIYQLMDNLFLMSMQGTMLYRGKACDAVEYFRSYGHSCPTNYNPPDFFMDLLVLDKLDKLTRESMVLNSCGDISEEDTWENNEIIDVIEETRHDRYHHSWYNQFKILLERDWIISTQDFITKTTCMLNAGNLLIQVGLFWQLPSRESDILPHFAGLLWMFGMWLFYATMGSVPVFHTVHDQVEKELQVGAYRLSAFFTAKSCVELLLGMFWPTVLLPFIFYSIYPYDGHVYKIFLAWLVFLLEILMCQSLGLMISAGISMERGYVMGILVITFYFGMSGFFNELHSWLHWILWTNIFIPTLTVGAAVFWIGTTWTCGETSDFESCPENEITQRDVMEKFFPMYMPSWSWALVYMIVASIFFRLLGYKFLRTRMSKNIGK